MYHHVINFLLSSELFGLRGEVEDYYYLNQGGAHMKDGNDDSKDNSKNYSKDYTATKVRDMLVEFNLFYMIFTNIPTLVCKRSQDKMQKLIFGRLP